MTLLTSPLKRQNLVSQVSAGEVTRPTGYYKSIAVDFFGVLSALGAGLAYRQYLSHVLPFWSVLLAAAIFMTFSTIGALLMRNPARRGFVLVAETVALLTFFSASSWQTLASLSAVLFCLLLWADISTYRELTGSVQVRFLHTTRSQFRKMTTALLIAGIVLYLPQWTPEQSFFSKENFQSIYSGVVQFARGTYPELRFDSTVENFATSLAQFEVKDDQTYAKLPAETQADVFSKNVQGIIETLHHAFAIDIEVQENLSDLLYRFFITLLFDWQNKFGSNFLIAWAIIAYAVLRSVGVLFYTLVGLCAFLFFEILIASNFIIVIGETKVQETVQYS